MKKFLEELNESGDRNHDTQMVMNRLSLISGVYSRKIMSNEYDLNDPENSKLNAMNDAIINTIIKVSSYSVIDHNVLQAIS